MLAASVPASRPTDWSGVEFAEDEDTMTQVNLYEAKTHLSELVERAAAGEEIVIAKAGTPRVKLVALVEPRPPRRPGRAKGRIRIASDFDAPLPEGFDSLAAALALHDPEAVVRRRSRARGTLAVRAKG